MNDVSHFKLPDVGEGLTEAEIVSWKVKPGDTVAVNQTIVDIETVKSVVELPCPWAGTVESLLVAEGETVEVGTDIIAVRTGVSAESAAAPAAADEPAEAPGEPEPEAERESVLVGYGPRTGPAKRRARKAEATERAAEPVETAAVTTTSAQASGPVLAKPPVRKLAKDLGIDLRSVSPSGAGGTVTRDDVRAAAEGATSTGAPAAPAVAGTTVETADASGAGWNGLPRTERVPVRSVRKATAQATVTSAFTAPHVSEFLTVDVTRSVKLLDRLRERREFRDARLSPLTLVARAMCVAIPRTPEVNARWEDGADGASEVVLQRYVNLGIAAATDRGLVVPKIHEAHELDLLGLAQAIDGLVARAREGKTPPEEMIGGTTSITNVGVFGVDTGTPILPPGEASIIALGSVREQPWVHNGKVKPRWVTTLGVSFDHRLVDGEQGSRYLADVGALLEDPGLGLAWG